MQGRDLSTLAPLRALRARTSNRTWARRAVGEGVRSYPRAGCGRSACPVRRAGCGNGVMATPLRHRQTKEAATDMCSLKPPRHISTLPKQEVTCIAHMSGLPIESGHREFLCRSRQRTGLLACFGPHIEPTYVSSAPARPDFKMFGLKVAPLLGLDGPRVRHRERGGALGSFGQSGEAQRRYEHVEVFLVAVRQSLRPAARRQVGMVGQHLPDCRACLVLTAKVPECRRKSGLRSQPAWLFYKDACGDVARCDKITEVKPRPRLVDLRFIASKWAESLRLLFIVNGLAEIAGIAVKHTCHMIGACVAGAEGNRLLSGSQGIVVA